MNARALAAALALSAGCAARSPAPGAPSPAGAASPGVPSTASASASAPAPAPTTPDAPFRAAPPPPDGTISWQPPHIDSWALPNGVRVFFVERRDWPLVAVRVVSRVGAGDLDGEAPSTVSFMGAMLEQGAGKRSALQLSDDYEALGADHGAWCDFDTCAARLKVLSSRLDPALDVLSDVVLRPTFADAEIDRARKRWLSALQQEKANPGVMEQNALAAALYGRAHPYGRSLRGTPAEISRLDRAAVVQAWRRAFEPRSTAIVVAGDVSPDALRRSLEARFGAWRGGAAERTPVRPVADARAAGSGVRVTLVDVPGAAQSQVYVAEVGAPFSTEDRIPLGVANAILGGMFSSRINLDLREARGITYGAHSRFAMRHGPGPFYAGGAVFTSHTGEAVHALLDQVARMSEAPVTAEELSDAKEHLRLALPARFEGVDDIAGALEEIAVYDLPLDEFSTRAARVERVTAEDVRRMARQWMRPASLRVVVAGDRARIEHDLSALGPIEVRDAYGDPAK